MTKVFIPHNVTRHNPAVNRRVPAFDFSDAATHGTLITILPDSADLFQTQERLMDIRNVIRSQMEVGDFFLPVGDPSIIALCSAVIAEETGQLRILKFDKKLQRYIKLEAFL